MQTYTESLHPVYIEWMERELARGCAPADVQAMMDKSGLNHALSSRTLATIHARLFPAALPAQPAHAPLVATPTIDLSGQPGVLDLGDRQARVLMAMGHPRIVVLGGFLSDAECDALIDGARDRITRSLGQAMTGESIVSADRTSDGMFYARGENPLLAAVEARIARLTQWPMAYAEPMQVLNYRPGAQYRPHQDYFDPANAAIDQLLARGGQRVGTVLLYLNTPEAGGGTTFPDVDLTVAAQRGNAVFFGYPVPDASMKVLHGGAPVVAGEKWVATKWLREREFDRPFKYAD